MGLLCCILKDLIACYLFEVHFKFKSKDKLKIRQKIKGISCKQHKKNAITILTLDKIALNARNVTTHKETLYRD